MLDPHGVHAKGNLLPFTPQTQDLVSQSQFFFLCLTDAFAQRVPVVQVDGLAHGQLPMTSPRSNMSCYSHVEGAEG